MVKRRVEAVTPPEIVHTLLSNSENDILVGGQALAYWAERYRLEIPTQFAAISADVDFLTASAAEWASVHRYARALEGEAYFPDKRAMTSLVGQAFREISEQEYLNVDVLWSLVGLDSAKVAERAASVTMDGVTFKVMHQLDVLKSRLVNLHKLRDKQNAKGEMQLRLAIGVAREFLREEAAEFAETLASGRSPIQYLVSEIERLAVEDAGRNVAARHGIHVADAIDPSLIPAGPFWTKRWPALRELMSEGCRAGFTPPQDSSSR